MQAFSVDLDTILIVHEDWVYGLAWSPVEFREGDVSLFVLLFSFVGEPFQPLRLLSASMDRSLIVWEPDPDSDLWIEVVIFSFCHH